MASAPKPSETSWVLLLLILITGIAIGWVLHDLWRPSPAAAPTIPATISLPPTAQLQLPSATPEPSVTPFPTTTPLPSATPTPVPSATPSATPTPEPTVIGYTAHTVQEGETLETLAAAGGSDPLLIRQYNRLEAEPLPGRMLIIPQLDARPSSLANEPLLVKRGPSRQPWVALTLDAGASSAPTGRMLQTLRERGVHITFFLTGKWIHENPELTRQIIADGHEIASHTYNHPDLTTLDDDQIRAELQETEDALHAVAPEATLRPLFRPPYGAYDDHVLQQVQSQGYLSIYWTLDSLDSLGEPKTAEFLLERVTTALTPEQLRGAIILAHCGNETTADALPLILDRFAEMGLQVMPLTDVLNS